MILAATASAAGLWGLRSLAHGAILRGLRAPRLKHSQGPADQGMAPGCVREVRITGPHGKQLFGWLVSPAQAVALPAPAVLVMHGWGANAATMWPVVSPLHSAGFAVLLIDARCHGRSDDEAFTSLPRLLAEKRVPYWVIGWYVMNHVQRVIGASFDEIAPLASLPRVRCPVLLVHGRSDKALPVDDAQRLHAASHLARLLLVEGGHDLSEVLAPYAARLVDFLRVACAAPVPAVGKGVA